MTSQNILEDLYGSTVDHYELVLVLLNHFKHATSAGAAEIICHHGDDVPALSLRYNRSGKRQISPLGRVSGATI